MINKNIYQLGLIWIVILLTLGQVKAQQIGQYTQYMSNELVINPAFAGSYDALSLTAIHRSQWSGMPGAPCTQSLSVHSLAKNEQVGIGLSLIKDQVGVHQNLSMAASYSYRLKLNPTSFISFALQAGINQKSSEYSRLNNQAQLMIDPMMKLMDISSTNVEFGTGAFLKTPKWQVGLSSPRLFGNKVQHNDSLSIALNKAHYFLYSRYRAPVSSNVKLQPNFLVKYLPGLPVSWDVGLNAIWNDVLLTGLSYRSMESLDVIVQAQITPQLKIGYSFDYTLAEVSNLGRSSNEFMLNYIFKYSNYRTKAPR